MLPELLTRINADEAARLVLDDHYWLQQKRDGVRLLVRRQGERIEGWNKQGRPTTVDAKLAAALLSLDVETFVLDGEFEKDHGYSCWDLLGADGVDLTETPYATRLGALKAFSACPLVHVLPAWTTPTERKRPFSNSTASTQRVSPSKIGKPGIARAVQASTIN